MVATITSKGQITLPRLIREKLNLSAGDKVDFTYDESLKRVILTPKNKKVIDAYGLLAHLAPEKSISVAEMNEGIANYMQEKHS